MGYLTYLRQLLQPLGVYDLRESSFSGGELAALGAVLDEADAFAQKRQKETLAFTAEKEGLQKMEALFPFPKTETRLDWRRNAVSGFLQISGDSFTRDSLERCLAACGTACMVTETDTPGVVRVRFCDVAGVPADFDAKKKIIESILPCHLDVEYCFIWCTWKALEQEGFLWESGRELTFRQLSLRNVEV